MLKSNEELDSVSKELNKLKIRKQANSVMKNRNDSIEIFANSNLHHISNNLSPINEFVLNFV